MKVFSDSQREQCLQSQRLRDLLPYIKCDSPESSVHIALGAILTSDTSLAGRFRSSDWTNLDEMLDQLIEEEQNSLEQLDPFQKELAKADRMQAIEEEIIQEIARQEVYLQSQVIFPQDDEFTYQSREQDAFDELIILDPFEVDRAKNELLEQLLGDERSESPTPCSPPLSRSGNIVQRALGFSKSGDSLNDNQSGSNDSLQRLILEAESANLI